MKTLKHITLVSGIILGILTIVGQSSLANAKNNKAAEKQKKSAFVMNQDQLQVLEYELIENYLEENQVEENNDEFLYIYTVEGKCVYKGEKNKADDLINKSDFLFKKGAVSYFLVIN